MMYTCNMLYCTPAYFNFKIKNDHYSHSSEYKYISLLALFTFPLF